MGGRVSRRRDDTQRPEKLAPVAAHRHSVTCITSFGEDGELMVTASEDRTICLWDLSVDGKYKRHWEMKALRGHGLQEGGGACDEDAPSHRRTVSSVQAGAMVSCPQSSRARDGHTHWVPHHSPCALLPLHTLMTSAYLCDIGVFVQITCVHVDGQSRLVYSGSMDKTVKVWDIYDAQCLRTYHAGSDWISGIHVRRDVVWTSSEDGCIRLWKAHPHVPPDADADVEIGDVMEEGAAIKLMVAPDRDHLLSGDASGRLCYWHLGMGMSKEACLQAVANTHVGIVACMAMPYHEEEVKNWIATRRRPLRSTPTTRALKTSAHLLPAAQTQGTLTAFVGGHLGVEMWTFSPPQPEKEREGWGVSARSSTLVRRFNGHQGGISCLVVVHGTLFTGSLDGCIRAWLVDTGDCVQMYQGHLSGVRCMQVLPYALLAKLGADQGKRNPVQGEAAYDGGVLCSGACDLRVWDIDSGDVLSVLWRRRVDHATVAGQLLIAACHGLVSSFDLDTLLKHRRAGLSSLVGRNLRTPVLRPSVVTEHCGGKTVGAGRSAHKTSASTPSSGDACQVEQAPNTLLALL